MANKQQSLSSSFTNLFAQMNRALNGPPEDFLKELRALPSCESLPSLWETWLLCAFIEYRERQDWGRQLLIENLPQAVPPCDNYCEREDQPVEGLLPGMPRWKVTVECTKPQFATLTNRDNDEMLSVDVGATATHPTIFTDSFFRLIRPSSRWEAGSRLIELTPKVKDWPRSVEVDAAEKLVSEGLLRGVYYDPTAEKRGVWPHDHRLTDKAMRYAPLVMCFCRAWKEPRNRLWASALVGDWLLAHELAVETGDTSLIRVAAERREECRQGRLSQLRDIVGEKAPRTLDLIRLADMGAPDLDDYVRKGIAGDATARESVLTFIAKNNDSRWCREVFDVLSSPECDLECSWVVICAEYLLDNNHRTDDVLNLVAERHLRPDEAAQLALEYAPELARPFARSALRFPLPLDVRCTDITGQLYRTTNADSNVPENMALTLAAINDDWTREELFNALAELRPEQPADQIRAVPLVIALRESGNESEEIIKAWLPIMDSNEVDAYSQECRSQIALIREQIGELRYLAPLNNCEDDGVYAYEEEYQYEA